MEYLINPSWFYWISVVDVLNGIAFAWVVISIAAIIVIGICSLLFLDDLGPNWWQQIKKIVVPFIITFIVAGLIMVFVPSKETLVEMQVAKMATYDNVALTIDGIKSITDYIINAIATVNGE